MNESEVGLAQTTLADDAEDPNPEPEPDTRPVWERQREELLGSSGGRFTQAAKRSILKSGIDYTLTEYTHQFGG